MANNGICGAELKGVLARSLPRALVALLVMVGAVVVPSLGAEAVTRPETLYHDHPLGAAPVEPGFPIDYVGVNFLLPEGADRHHGHEETDPHGAAAMAVRFRHAGAWGEWIPLEEDGAQSEGMWSSALVSGGDAEAYQVRGLSEGARGARGGALNVTDGPRVVVGSRPAGAAAATTPCKARVDWGADESLRTSTRSYADLQVMTVHHTATQNDDPDPDGRVRAIYEYHVRHNRWDDIGYQALISEDGTVYEGRWSGSDKASCRTAGGDSWAFGHNGDAADAHVVTGAHTGGHNTGNFGVALLGTLTDVVPKAAARAALVDYLAELSKRHGVDPTSKVVYTNANGSKEVDAISGHRDFTSTECPGGMMYADLPTLRTDTKAALGPAVTIETPVSDITVDAGTTVLFDAGASQPVTWAWRDGAGTLLSTAESFSRSDLPAGRNVVTVTGTAADGSSSSDSVTVEVRRATTDLATATSDTTVAGTKAGTYLDTHGDDATVETITEVVSTQKSPKTRYSYLDHRWTLSVPAGVEIALNVDAAATSSYADERFALEWSTDGTTFTRALTFAPGENIAKTVPLPDSATGTVTVRVVDLYRSGGKTAKGSIAVDHLVITSR